MIMISHGVVDVPVGKSQKYFEPKCFDYHQWMKIISE